MDKRFLVLADDDNIAVATTELAAGVELNHHDQIVILQDTVDVGHKFALRTIQPGEKIIKYRAPIGSASRMIAAGEYVHTHNMESDYLPTYTLSEPENT